METLESKMIEKRLSKYTTEQLLKKVNEKLFSSDEDQIAKIILTKRGKWNEEKQDESASTEPKEKSISEIIDEIYAMEDREFGRKLCNLFPDEFEDYDQLPEEVKEKVKDFYFSIINPTGIVLEKPKNKEKKTTSTSTEKPKKEKKQKVELTNKITLSPTQIEEIKNLRKEGKSIYFIRKQYSTTWSHINNILK